MNLVGGVAGALIGSFFGPLGASIGWSVGSAIGSAFMKRNGPQLTDLKLQTSAYGTPIPILYGTIRASGASVIWQTDLQPHKNTSTGKGGNRATQTTYSYSASFAVLLYETTYLDVNGNAVNNPMLGLLRIWADNRLWWQQGQRVGTGPAPSITIYYGTETQLPDPTMQAALGAANVPAHRGYAYLVFNNLDLTEFFNRIPQFTFEIQATGDLHLQQYANWDVDWNLHGDHSTFAYPAALSGQSYDPTTGLITATQWRAANDYGGTNGVIEYAKRVYTLQGSLVSSTSSSFTELPPSGVPGMATSMGLTPSFNSVHHERDYEFATGDCLICDGHGVVRFLETSEWQPAGSNVGFPFCALCEADGGYPSGTGSSLGIGTAGNISVMYYYNGFVYASGGGASDDPDRGGPGVWVARWPCDADGNITNQEPDATFLLRNTITSGSPYGHIDAGSASITAGDDGFIYVIAGSAVDTKHILLKLTADLQTVVHAWDPFLYPSASSEASSFVVFQNHLLVQANEGGAPTATILNPGIFLYSFNADFSFTLVDHLFGTPSSVDGLPSPLIYLGAGYVAWRGGILNLGGQTTYGAIFADISNRVGIGASQVDVTDIPEVCLGYAIGQQMDARSACESLMPADLFDVVESDGKVKCVKRGKHPSIGVIDAADLGVRDSGAAAIPTLQIDRLDDAQLPRRIYVKYFNVDADYLDGTQVAQRQVSFSELDVTVNLPISMHDADAKIIAESLLASAWAERDKYVLQTSWKWAYLDPADVASPENFAMRLTSQSLEGGVVKWEAVGMQASAFIQPPTPVSPQIIPRPPPAAIQPTDLLLMDIPLATDLDQPNGYYAAMAGSLTNTWPGAELYRSVDGGVTFVDTATGVTADIFGTTTTILGNFTLGNVFDEINTVTVVLVPGSPAPSGMGETGVLNGGNLALVGSEIIQFKNVLMISTTDFIGNVNISYRFSGLLRGRRGTEWAIGTHANSESFCVLPPAVNVPGPFAELSVAEIYKAVTIGTSITSTATQNFENTGNALTPYAPVQIGGGRNGAGDITINWDRRTRVGGQWKDFVEVPLSETSERYIFEVYTDGTFSSVVFGVSTLSSPTYTFTASQQTTYFGGLQTTLYVSVVQGGSYQFGTKATGAI